VRRNPLDVFIKNNSVRKPEWTTTFGRQKSRREDNIKIDAQKVKYVSAHKIHVGSCCCWGGRGGGEVLF